MYSRVVWDRTESQGSSPEERQIAYKFAIGLVVNCHEVDSLHSEALTKADEWRQNMQSIISELVREGHAMGYIDVRRADDFRRTAKPPDVRVPGIRVPGNVDVIVKG